jgi:energy-coupling factor transporter ATP-binding protein EcfA2
MIELDHISYWYPNRPQAALRDLSLRLQDGESVCVMGRNGSGKTTLVKLIAGLVKPDRGHLRADGRLRTESGDGQVGILFQNPDNQMVATLVEKEIAFALENRAMPQAEMESVIAGVAGQFGIARLLNRLTSELSGGEKQRVALASVMVQNPCVLLLDEPDSFLDQEGRRILTAELARLHRDDVRLIEIRITQSAQVARDYARLIVLNDGTVVADGKPEGIFGDQRLCSVAGLTIPDLSQIQVTVPSSLKSGEEADDERLSSVLLEQVSFAWPMCEPVFHNINLSLAVEETVGLVGPTGVGKSSLGLLIAGLLKADEGRILYLHKNGLGLTDAVIRGQLALMLQQPERQFFLESCAEEVAFGPNNRGRTLDSTEINSFLEMVGLNPARFADRDPFSLSAGEKRRLAFAAVLAMAPSFVIFDEPTAGLDGEGVGRFIALSRALRRLRVGQVIISHDGDVVRQLCDRALYITRRGDLLPLSLSELFDDPRYAGVVSSPVLSH